MKPPLETQSWFGVSVFDGGTEPSEAPAEFDRLWRGFMSARLILGLVLLLLQGAMYSLGTSRELDQVLVGAVYLVATTWMRLFAQPRPWGESVDLQWLATIGVDLLCFAALQAGHASNLNYTPLFALPILMTAVFGSLQTALGTAAGVTLLMFGNALWLTLQVPVDAAAQFLQAALTGSGGFVISLIAHQVATRLVRVELRAQRTQLAVRAQRQVNALVIDSLTEGVLVLDTDAAVRAANPAAHTLLGTQHEGTQTLFNLGEIDAWKPLHKLMLLSFQEQNSKTEEISIHRSGAGPLRLKVRTQLTAAPGSVGERLCVMFIQDQREVEARIRTEKLASMGRMSAAVAHEIRNPLAAIAQANALLDEDLTDARHKQLTHMVQQNAKRLGKIVEDILNVSRVQRSGATLTSQVLVLNTTVERICQEWLEQHKVDGGATLDWHLSALAIEVRFETEHLRRVLINLLDNAQRHASGQAQSMQVTAGNLRDGQAFVSVWSDGPPLDQSVERHLFEPFFSSESRSSGLGLFICRELCEGHGAAIGYHRAARRMQGTAVDGNEFTVTFLKP